MAAATAAHSAALGTMGHAAGSLGFRPRNCEATCCIIALASMPLVLAMVHPCCALVGGHVHFLAGTGTGLAGTGTGLADAALLVSMVVAGAADASAVLEAGTAAATPTFGGTATAAIAPLAPMAAEAAFCASAARNRRTVMRKLATRRASLPRFTLPATISASSGFASQGLLVLRLRSSSETRSLDCATPVSATTGPFCFMLVRYT